MESHSPEGGKFVNSPSVPSHVVNVGTSTKFRFWDCTPLGRKGGNENKWQTS